MCLAEEIDYDNKLIIKTLTFKTKEGKKGQF
jgi:hypothetical protein